MNKSIIAGVIGVVAITSVAVTYKSIKVSTEAYAIVKAYSVNNKMTLQDSASAIIVDQSKFYEALTDYCEGDWRLGYRATTTKGLLQCITPSYVSTSTDAVEDNG